MASRNTKRGIGAFAAGAMQSARGQIAKGRERRAQGEAAATKTLTDRSNLEYEWGQRKDIAQIGAGARGGDPLKTKAGLAQTALRVWNTAKEDWNVIGRRMGFPAPTYSDFLRKQYVGAGLPDPGEITLEDSEALINASGAAGQQGAGGNTSPDSDPLTQAEIDHLLKTQSQAEVDKLIQKFGRTK